MRECKECGSKYSKSDKGAGYKYCSRECASYTPVEPKKIDCEHCGKEFESKFKPKYCSDRCKWNASYKRNGKTNPKYIITCIGCGEQAEVTQKDGKYCSDVCFQKYTDYSHVRDRAFTRTCITCEQDYETSCPSSKYCSDECNPSNWERCNIYYKECTVCDDLFVAGNSGKIYCSDKCSNKAQYSRLITNRLNNGEYNKDCMECGDEFNSLFGKHRNFCSDTCCDEYRRRYERACETHRARARKYGVYYERVHRIEVFKRDNYTCQDCGIKTDKELVGKNTNKDNEPTLDHVVPISLGGPHSYSNVQCLCRKCNIIKSNNYEGQLTIL